MPQEKVLTKQFIVFSKQFAKHGIDTRFEKQQLFFRKNNKSVSFFVAGENFNFLTHQNESILPLDQLLCDPMKIEAVILSKLKLNKTIFARSCEVKRVNKKHAEEFLNQYHIMNSTQSAFNLGLYYQDELIALASFSKGRKMNRLQAHERSFELIRFCCKSGITVTGGLTRLIKNFCAEKSAGDIMTYVDKQLSDGTSFIRAGFKKHSETEPNYFLINRFTFERIPANKDESFDTKNFYLTQNSGNIKLIFTPNE